MTIYCARDWTGALGYQVIAQALFNENDDRWEVFNTVDPRAGCQTLSMDKAEIENLPKHWEIS